MAEIEAYSTAVPCFITPIYFLLTDFVRKEEIVPPDQHLALIVKFKLEDILKKSFLIDEIRKIPLLTANTQYSVFSSYKM